jgi:hypothetical protein
VSVDAQYSSVSAFDWLVGTAYPTFTAVNGVFKINLSSSRYENLLEGNGDRW